MLDGGCMLCDMRDLAHCVAINKQWNHAAQTVLYDQHLLPLTGLSVLMFSASTGTIAYA